MRPLDGTLHFSNLKKLAESPADYKLSCETDTNEPTPAMRIGSGVSHMVLGPNSAHPVVFFDGKDRRDKTWKDFAAANTNATILTPAERSKCEEIADAVKRSAPAMRLLTDASFETPLRWEMHGFPCSTSGVDILNAGILADLKVTSSTRPDKWMRHALNMLYPQQLVYYAEGCRQNGIDISRGLKLLGVAGSAPFNVVVLSMPPSVIEMAERSLVHWFELLRSCESADHWPGYAEDEIELELPAWLEDEKEDEDEPEAA